MEYKIASQRCCSCVANCDANSDKLFPDMYIQCTHYMHIKTQSLNCIVNSSHRNNGKVTNTKKIFLDLSFIAGPCAYIITINITLK